MDIQNEGSSTNIKVRRIALAALGAVVLGAIGSGVWDVIAKPGLSRIGSLLSALLSNWSASVRDLPYSSAALDPSSLPSLITLYALVFAVPSLVLIPVIQSVIGRRTASIVKKIRSKAASRKEGTALVNAYFKKRLRTGLIIVTIYAVFLYQMNSFAFHIVNRAVAIRRVHQANMQIIKPYVSTQVYEHLQGQFASVTTKDEYTVVKSQIEKIAADNNVKLRGDLVP